MRVMLAAVNCQKGRTEQNLEVHRKVVADAQSEGCDMVVFPEMSLTGYLDPSRNDQRSISLESEAVRTMCEFSKSFDIGILFGIAEENGSAPPFISQVYAADGAVRAVYQKRHLGENEIGMFTPGRTSVTVGDPPGRFGVAICADRNMPDEFEFAAQAGAGIVFHPSAPGLWGRRTSDESWRDGFDWWRNSCIEIHSKRAADLGVAIAVVTQAGSTEDEDFPGWAGVIGRDGRVVAELTDWYPGTLVVEI